ncbi:MAG: ABC transporter substrate-binding protein [Acetatifactor sp.]|nr:ABC transporter substrate-binding protein [Acetatifactor sp.]
MKKKLALLLTCSMVMLGLAACGSEKAASSTVPTVVDGVLTMGTNAQFPPYEFYDGDQIVGIDAEIAQAIADKLGMKLEITDMDFGSIITSVQAGKVDVGIAGMTVNEERLQNVNFSTSYATGVQAIIVKEDSDIASPDDLAGKLIGVQENTTGHIYCEDDFGTENVIAYTNGATAVQALAQGKVDCVVIDNEPAKNFVSTNEGLKILNTEYVTEDYAIAISKDNEELLNAVDGALKELIADGTVQTILDKYIKAE